MKLTPHEQALFDRFHAAGQGHVFAFWDWLDEAGRERLLGQLESLDMDSLARAQALLTRPESRPVEEAELTPVASIRLAQTPQERAEARRIADHGEAVIRQGRVAAFVVAGGQGSRLGFEGPKGAFVVGPVTQRTLFQLFAEKILAASRRYGVTIPWYIMTSQANDAETRDFFDRHGHFGLDPKDVVFFAQRMIPALDERGRLILDAPDHLFMSPNGHGGALLALKEGGALEDMTRRGIDMLSYFQVDNVLIRPVDPLFIGHHELAGAEMSSKMLIKRDPWEKVGVFGRAQGRLRVVEYSDLSEAEATARHDDGSLVFGAGSIAIHLIQRDFIEKLTLRGLNLPYHVAHKKIPCLDELGRMVQPESPNGYKFETFVFDALEATTSSVILEVAREEEFSPVKNAEGEDSLATARRDMTAQYARWLEAAGVDVPRNADGDVAVPIEISPLYADGPEALAQRLAPGFVVNGPVLLTD